MCNTTPTFITDALHLVTCVQLLNYPFGETNNFYSASIALLGWLLSQCISLLWPCLLIELLHYVSKCSKTSIHIQYHMNIIYSLRGRQTHAYVHACTHTRTHMRQLPRQNNFKKPGTHWPTASVRLV